MNESMKRAMALWMFFESRIEMASVTPTKMRAMMTKNTNVLVIGAKASARSISMRNTHSK